jgi:hypothetical protein
MIRTSEAMPQWMVNKQLLPVTYLFESLHYKLNGVCRCPSPQQNTFISALETRRGVKKVKAGVCTRCGGRVE